MRWRTHLAQAAALRQGSEAVNEFAGAGGHHHLLGSHPMPLRQTLAQGGIGRIGVMLARHLLHSLQGGRTGAAGIGIGRKIPARHAQGIGATVLQRGHWRIQYSIHTAKIIATPASPIRLKAVFSP